MKEIYTRVATDCKTYLGSSRRKLQKLGQVLFRQFVESLPKPDDVGTAAAVSIVLSVFLQVIQINARQPLCIHATTYITTHTYIHTYTWFLCTCIAVLYCGQTDSQPTLYIAYRNQQLQFILIENLNGLCINHIVESL